MRIGVIGEKATIQSLQEELERDPSANVTSSKGSADLTEQNFAVADAASVVAIVKTALDLAKLAWTAIRRQKGTQKLTFRSAAGQVTIELSTEITVEELRQSLAPLFSPS